MATRYRRSEKRLCYFKLSYGEIPPNADTEDLLLILIYLAYKQGNPTCVKTSFYEIAKLKGVTGHPSGKDKKIIVRQLKALTDIKIDTNFLYNRDKQEWFGADTRIISGFEYKPKDKPRKIPSDSLDDSSEDTHVEELDKIFFTKTFIEYFVKDSIDIDLSKYLSLSKPTAKRLYRYASKYTKQFGSFGLDLVHFCVTRLGMDEAYVKRFRYVSQLARKLRPHTSRVNDTYGDMLIEIVKDKHSASGYKILFSKPEKPRLQLNVESLTRSEYAAYQTLLKEGVYKYVAYDLLVKFRKQLGDRAVPYLNYCVRMFTKYQKKHALVAPEDNKAAVLVTFIRKDFWFPEFMEWYSGEQKRLEREKAKRFAKGLPATPLKVLPTPQSSVQEKLSPQVSAMTAKFNLEQFVKDYPEVYERIYNTIRDSHLRLAKEAGMIEKDMHFESLYRSSIEFHCEKCFREFMKGNTNYVHDLLIYAW